MKRQRGGRRFYTPRRVPHTFAPAYVRMKLIPLVPSLVATAAVGMMAQVSVFPKKWRFGAEKQAQIMGSTISQRSQKLFFDEPGLDTLFVRNLAHAAFFAAQGTRLYLRARYGWNVLPGRLSSWSARATSLVDLIPTGGYEALMTGMLAISTALGITRGGTVHSQVIHDSAHTPPTLPAVAGHPAAHLRHVEPPRTLGDMCADIDEMYWSMTAGQTIKITRVGSGESRRWVVSVPGTANMDFRSTMNPADMESNMREVLGFPSGIRRGVVAAIREAMRIDGVHEDDITAEPVLICGHSQAGILAAALASLTPVEAGINVEAVLTVGAPSRRVRVRPGVSMIAVAHDQDIVPSTDGRSDHVSDHRVLVGRNLVCPRKDPLYYAHSSATYTETVRQLERKAMVVHWGKVAQTVAALQDYLPVEDEDTRVFYFEIWQDLRDGDSVDLWDALADATGRTAVRRAAVDRSEEALSTLGEVTHEFS